MAAPATGGRFPFFEFKACPKFLLRRTRKKQGDHENGSDFWPKLFPESGCHSFVKSLNRA